MVKRLYLSSSFLPESRSKGFRMSPYSSVHVQSAAVEGAKLLIRSNQGSAVAKGRFVAAPPKTLSPVPEPNVKQKTCREV